MKLCLRTAQEERQEDSFELFFTFFPLKCPGLFCITLLAELLTGTANLVEHQEICCALVLPLPLKATLLVHLL